VVEKKKKKKEKAIKDQRSGASKAHLLLAVQYSKKRQKTKAMAHEILKWACAGPSASEHGTNEEAGYCPGKERWGFASQENSHDRILGEGGR